MNKYKIAIVAKNKKIIHTPEWNRNIGLGQLGKKYPNRKLSETHKANISLARKKEWQSGKRKMWKLTPEIIEKIRQKSIGRKTPIEVRKKQSIVRLNNPKTPRGEFHHSWKGGVMTETRKIRQSLEYKLWREAVFKRDNYTCIWCGIRSAKGVRVYLHADHIKSFALFPELRFSIDNGRTLCRPCHLTTNTYGGRTK